MKPETAAEFCFAGAASMSGLFLWLGDPGLAVMVGVPLLLGGCLCSMADPGAPFRSMAAKGAPPPGANHSGMRHVVPHARQRTRSQGQGKAEASGSR